MEYMIRWKRKANNAWYYYPRVFGETQEPKRFIERSLKNQSCYKIELVSITPQVVYEETDESAESPVQPATVEPKVPKARGRGRKRI